MSNKKPRKIKCEKFYTRAKAEKLLAAGADPTSTFVDEKSKTQGRFVNHPNYHVRAKAWHKMGCPLPATVEEQNAFLVSLQGKEVPKDKEAADAFIATLRLRFLKEPLPVVAPPTE